MKGGGFPGKKKKGDDYEGKERVRRGTYFIPLVGEGSLLNTRRNKIIRSYCERSEVVKRNCVEGEKSRNKRVRIRKQRWKKGLHRLQQGEGITPNKKGASTRFEMVNWIRGRNLKIQ